MSEQKQIIIFDAPEAASLQTVTGRASTDGRLFGQDENSTLFCGATTAIMCCIDFKRQLLSRTFHSTSLPAIGGERLLYTYNQHRAILPISAVFQSAPHFQRCMVLSGNPAANQQ